MPRIGKYFAISIHIHGKGRPEIPLMPALARPLSEGEGKGGFFGKTYRPGHQGMELEITKKRNSS